MGSTGLMMAVRTVDAAPESDLQRFRCCSCGRTLFKVSASDFVRPGHRVQVKCGHCNSMNHVMGLDKP